MTLPIPEDLLKRLLERIEKLSGLQMGRAQDHTLRRTLQKRSSGDLAGVVKDLLEQPDRAFLEGFVQELTIHETYFFRGEQQMQQLRTHILPELQKRSGPLKVWSAGCSTGEEAYTLSILLKRESKRPDAVVLGTDLHPDAIQKARIGKYREWSFRTMPPEVREACFLTYGDLWHIMNPLKQHVHFGVLNLKQMPWKADFGAGLHALDKLDLILCRNVTLYFSNPSAQQVYREFARRLKPDGFLMLGATDPLPEPQTGFHPHAHPLGMLWRTFPALSQCPAVPPAQTAQVLPAKTGVPSVQKVAPVQPVPPVLLGPVATPSAPQETLEALRQHVFLHPEDALAVFRLAQMWIGRQQPTRALALLRHLQQVLAALPPEQVLSDELTVQELRSATFHTLARLKGNQNE
ncbi:CheR family methyltransferase [Deinococcus misasensis]|uniref:CheR family methyltransferase n=1 Tax=Deinococcus misasensis TaxID=392413 RepID=UPI0006891DFD|nr:protein-glutamate O-methyltransferase CheR [Deinococcus misasensis]